MAERRSCILIASVLLLAFVSLAGLANAIHEDQVGLADWHQKYIGKVKQAVFHSHKTGRKRVVVLTEENVIASLDLRTGDIFWRHVLGKDDPLEQLSLSLGKYVITLSSEGSLLRAWNLPDGQMIWEANLPDTRTSKPLLHVVSTGKAGKENAILVSSGQCIHAVSSVDGAILWRKELRYESLQIKQVFQSLENDTLYVIGITGSLELLVYTLSAKDGEVLMHTKESFPNGLHGDSLIGFANVLVALDATKTTLYHINFGNQGITYAHVHSSNFVQDVSGSSELIHVGSNGIFALKSASGLVLLQVKEETGFEVIENINQPAVISDTLNVAEEEQAFAVIRQFGGLVETNVKLTSNLASVFHKVSVKIDQHRGRVEKVFLNNYVRTDRSYGFRAMLVMEDCSLLLVQQGEIVWSREDGLASVIDVTTSELPLEKEGVSVVDVEHGLLEWLKGHLLKLKATLMLANADEIAAIQALRVKSSQKTKMTMDHNGFRKLIIVLTKAGKVLALHTGDGRIVWSHLLSSLRLSHICEHPIALKLQQWRVPHHHARNENPSVVVVGKCGTGIDIPGVLTILDSYSGNELNSLRLAHSVSQIIPLNLKDSPEQRLYLIVDANLNAHLYPRTADSLDVFLREITNIYVYSEDAEKNIIRGFSLQRGSKDNGNDVYCFSTKELWSIVFPNDSEKLATTAGRKKNEIVHTQTKVTANQDVMYKYLSKNLLFVATISPKAAGPIGSAAPEEAWLVVYLVDAVTGRILHHVTHQGAQGPIHPVVSENWVVYHYFNIRAHRYEMSVIEIYDQSKADNKDVFKLVLGQHHLSEPITSFSRPEVIVKSQSYFFTHSVKAITVTATAKGITSKQLLIGTAGDQILALDKRYVDPRRTPNPTQAEKEDGVIPLTDSLPIHPQSYVTHSLQVEGLRGIIAVPSKLESTTLVFSYGVDLFYTRLAPSKIYDSLTDEFSYALLLITIVVLVAAIIVTWVLAERKELRDKWR